MRIVLFSVSLIFSFTAQAAKPTYTWDKKEIESLKAKTLYSVYCAKPGGLFTTDACRLNKSELGFKNYKLKTIEWMNPTKIRVGDGVRTVEILRGPGMGEFTLNGRAIDFSTSTPAEIRKKITEALPKVASGSFFMNAAQAEVRPSEDVYLELNRAVLLIESQTTDAEVCKTSHRIIELCRDGKRMPGADDLISALEDYSALKPGRNDQEEHNHAKGYAAKKVLTYLDELNIRLTDSVELLSRASHAAENFGYCQVSYDGYDRWNPEDAFAQCNFKIQNEQRKLNNTITAAGVHDDAKYYDDEIISQKLFETSRKLHDIKRDRASEKSSTGAGTGTGVKTAK